MAVLPDCDGTPGIVIVLPDCHGTPGITTVLPDRGHTPRYAMRFLEFQFYPPQSGILLQ